MSDNRSAKASEQLPISAHPAFPVIVALWFAALLGLGCLVLPTALIEQVAVGSGLSSLIGAAQPPLGVTARILVAVAAAALGAAGGLLIARKVAAASAPQPVHRRAAGLRGAADDGETFAKRPISAREELGEEGLDEPLEAPRAAIPGRRRPLSVTEENARSEFLDFAPLPGQAYGQPAEPLDLVAFVEPVQESEPATRPAHEQPIAAEPAAAPAEPAIPFGTASLSGPGPSVAYQDFVMPQPAAPDPAPAPAPIEAAESQPDAAEPSGLSSLGMVELVERFARALQHHQSEAAAAAAQCDPTPLVFPPAAPFAAIGEPASVPSVPTIPAALRPIDLDLPDSDDESVLPGLDLAAALGNQHRPFAAPADSPKIMSAETVAAIEDDGEDVAEESYPSLLAMKSVFGAPRESVRIDDDQGDDSIVEPVVVFPGQGARRAAPAADGPAHDSEGPFASPSGFRAFDRPRAGVAASDSAQPFAPTRSANPAETERALREALEKLQRLSGAA